MIAPHDQIAGTSADFATIERQVAAYDQENQNLELMIAELEHDLEAIKNKHLRGLKKQAGVVANLEAQLHSSIESAPALFNKPRTITIHGTKIGFVPSVGSVAWNDDDQVCTLIKRHFKARAAEFIKTEETPKKDALRSLSEADLAKVGCHIEGAGDHVLIKRVAGDVEKLINKLIDKLVSSMIEDEQ